MRLFLLCCLLAVRLAAAVPPPLEAALKTFRADPPKGWSFTQTTAAEGKSTVERYDATRPEFDRWALLQKDGQTPSADALREYHDTRSRHSRTGTAPKLVEQLDYSEVETVSETADRAVYRCRVRPGESRDRTAEFLRATLTVHKPTQTLETIELTNTEPFAPTIGVKIRTMHTRLTYTLPQEGAPSLPRQVSTQVAGTAFWFKSLDADLKVTFSEFAPPAKK